MAPPVSPTAERILALYRTAGIVNPPAPTALGHLVGTKRAIALGLVEQLLERGDLVRLMDGWVVARTAVDEAAERLRTSSHETIDVAEFKQLFGLSRKLAIPLIQQLRDTGVLVEENGRKRIVR